ncbi:MAG: Omp28-related outer membrane protein [candidate division WOR-3 bacterium]
MLDQICRDYAGYVVAVAWHVDAQFPLHSPEGRLKWRMYPPPYNGSYATPWLWVDGRQRGYQYSLWPNYVSQRVTVPTPVSIAINGTYDQGTRTGIVQAVLQNDSSAAITARVSVVITEDSCYYLGPNGDPWHNHVCRDYIPDQNGTVLTIPAGAADTVELPFLIQSGWREDRCKLVVYAQSTTMVPSDSSFPAFQGASTEVLSLVGLEESERADIRPRLHISPNPCPGVARFTLCAGSHVSDRLRYCLSIFSADGRLVRRFDGVSCGTTEFSVGGLETGVFLCRFECAGLVVAGRLIVSH